VRRTVLAGLLLGALTATAACTGSDSGDADPPAGASASAAAPQPDLPAEVDDSGPVLEPAMEPVWLLRSTGTDESTRYDLREQGVFVDGDVAVYFALDTLLGLSMADGSTIWRTPVDMGGETVSFAGTATHGDHRWSYVYPETTAEDLERWGDHVVTVDVRTGEVVGDRALGSYGAVDSLTSMVTGSGARDFLATDGGVFEITDRGGLTRVLPATVLGPGGPTIRRMVPVRDTEVLVLELATSSTQTTTAVAGLDTATGRLLWTHDVGRFATGRDEAGNVFVSPGDGRYVTRADTRTSADGSIDDVVHLWTLDPQTGAVRAHQRLGLLPAALTPVGDDVVLEGDGGSVSRYRPLTGRTVWTLAPGELTLRAGGEAGAAAGFSLGPTSPDGTLVYAGFSAGPSGDLVAIDLESGALAARWALDDEQHAGLVTSPLMALDGDRMVLARNRSSRGDPAALDDQARPLGPVNDVGLFRFPDLGERAASR